MLLIIVILLFLVLTRIIAYLIAYRRAGSGRLVGGVALAASTRARAERGHAPTHLRVRVDGARGRGAVPRSDTSPRCTPEHGGCGHACLPALPVDGLTR